jgi:inner membrane protein
MIQSLVAEREARRQEAVAGIAQGWGLQQIVAGPYLAIPYERTWTDVTRETVEGKSREKRTERTEYATVRIPADNVEWTIRAEVSEKARGIYKARLYGASARVQGRVTVPARFGITDTASRYKFSVPRLVVGISDAHGIRSVSRLTFDDKSYEFGAGSGDYILQGLHARLPEMSAAKVQTLEFAFSLELAGSEALSVAPLGSDMTVSMQSDWRHPSFQGRFLPARHETGADGFAAQWKISRFAVQGEDSLAVCRKPCASLTNERLIVSFIEPAGIYQQLERASKYGFLFIGLTFAARSSCW